MPPWMALTWPSSEVPAPNGDDRQLEARADPQDLRDFVGRVRKADDVGARRRVVRLAAAVMIADGRRVVRARAKLLL